MYRYIIVDDEPLIRRGILKKITSFGPEVSYAGEADNGETALQLIREQNPDIVLIDMRMPVMDGKSLLKVLQRDYPGVKIIVISGYTDFEYMREAISANVVGYLLKPFSREEIRDALKKAAALLDQDQSAKAKMESMTVEKEQLSYATDLQSLAHIILGIHKKDDSFKLCSAGMQSFLAAAQYILLTVYSATPIGPDLLAAFLENNPSPISCLNAPHPQNDHLGLLICCSQSGNTLEMVENAAQIAEAFLKFIDQARYPNIGIGISSIKSKIAELNPAYLETIAALNGKSVSAAGGYYSYKEKAVPAEPVIWEKSDELIFYCESGNVKQVEALSHQYFEWIRQTEGITVGGVKRSLQRIVKEIGAVSARPDLEEPTIPSFEVITESLFDFHGIQAYAIGFLTETARKMSGRSIYNAQNIVDNIKTYINKNYAKEMTLQKIGALFYLNPSYCSYLFKEKTGENIIDYINRVRIAKAKEYLKDTNEKIYKIAKNLGYDNPKYFFRVFKKITDYTPEEYRMLTKTEKP